MNNINLNYNIYNIKVLKCYYFDYFNISSLYRCEAKRSQFFNFCKN